MGKSPLPDAFCPEERSEGENTAKTHCLKSTSLPPREQAKALRYLQEPKETPVPKHLFTPPERAGPATYSEEQQCTELKVEKIFWEANATTHISNGERTLRNRTKSRVTTKAMDDRNVKKDERAGIGEDETLKWLENLVKYLLAMYRQRHKLLINTNTNIIETVDMGENIMTLRSQPSTFIKNGEVCQGRYPKTHPLTHRPKSKLLTEIIVPTVEINAVHSNGRMSTLIEGGYHLRIAPKLPTVQMSAVNVCVLTGSRTTFHVNPSILLSCTGMMGRRRGSGRRKPRLPLGPTEQGGNSLDSHLGAHWFDSRSGHPDFGFPWFSEICPGEYWDGSLTKATSDSFPFLPQTLFPDQPASSLITSLSTRHNSPPTEPNRVQFPAGSTLYFRIWESCRTMLLFGWFYRGSPISTTLAFRRCSILTSLHPHRLSRPRRKELPKSLLSLCRPISGTKFGQPNYVLGKTGMPRENPSTTVDKREESRL
ncbi:hypothetical protein PR048_011783 [Dryococelus australis]|uniref:Envelope protein n=1 Tax=Dryococelus australis TaxID=614101 RepID=A0ABQ9HMH3_9NEOP|nr:hypothetical protein PR048_011783 [Dryococelus australis]